MKRDQQSTKTSLSQESDDRLSGSTTVGNISGGKGFAIGPGATSIFIEIGSLFNLSEIFTFIRKYWLFLLINIIIQSPAIILWVSYANRFLIPVWVFLVGIFLLELCILAGFGLSMQSKYRLHSSIFLATFVVSLAGLTTMQYKQSIHPTKFSQDVFGVAIAQFGEGPDLKSTPKSREISQVVLQHLERQIEENPDLRFVQFRPIGLIKTQEQAIADGSRIGADLVIWGQLQVSEDQTILNFSILETPEKVSNPMFPRLLPLYDTAAFSFIEVESQGSEDISKGTTRISAYTFGLAHFFKYDFRAAARAFEEALAAVSDGEKDNYHYFINYYYGLSLQKLGKIEEANEQFQQAIDIHPEDPAPWLARAFSNRALDRVEEAQKDAQIAFELCSDRIQLEPEDYVAYYDRAHASEILEDWDASHVDLKKVTEIAPDLFISYISLARTLIELKLLEEAALSSQKAITLAENVGANPAWGYLYLGRINELLEDPDMARLYFDKAIELAPDVDYIHYKYGNFLAETGIPGDLLAAENEYKTYIMLSSDKAQAHSVLAYFYAQQNRFDEALAEYHAGLQYNQGSVNAWTGLADTLAQLNRNDEALDAFNHALELGPRNFYAHASYGNYLLRQGEVEAAIVEYQFARELDSENCILLLNLGYAYELLGDWEGAEENYRIAHSGETEIDTKCQAEATRRLAELGK